MQYISHARRHFVQPASRSHMLITLILQLHILDLNLPPRDPATRVVRAIPAATMNTAQLAPARQRPHPPLLTHVALSGMIVMRTLMPEKQCPVKRNTREPQRPPIVPSNTSWPSAVSPVAFLHQPPPPVQPLARYPSPPRLPLTPAHRRSAGATHRTQRHSTGTA